MTAQDLSPEVERAMGVLWRAIQRANWDAVVDGYREVRRALKSEVRT